MGSENNRLHQLKLLVTNAKLKEPPGLFTKGDPYAEVTVDGQPPHKTDPAKGTWEPCWNHPFDLLVSVVFIVLCFISPRITVPLFVFSFPILACPSI